MSPAFGPEILGMANPSPPAAIILAGGEGRRFRAEGGGYKLLATLPDGRAMIRAVCELALSVTDVVCVAGRCELTRIDSALSDLPVELLACPSAVRGPGAAIKCALDAIPPGRNLMIFLADMPWVSRRSARAVALALSEGAELVRPVYQGQPGHPVGMASRWRDELRYLPDRHGASVLLTREADRMTFLADRDEGCVLDIDRPADLTARATRFP